MENTGFWFDKPANSFVEALPVGNGSLGGMVYGGFPKEKISLNRDTFWSGTGELKKNIISNKRMNQVKEMIMEQKYVDAEKIIENEMLVSYTESYMPVGDFNYTYYGSQNISDYRRFLNMERGSVITEFKVNNNEIKSEVFSSYVNDILILRIQSEKEKFLHIDFTFHTSLKYSVETDLKSRILFEVEAPSHVEPNYIDTSEPIIYAKEHPGLRLGGAIQIDATDGKMYAYGSKVEVMEASEIIVYLTAYSGYQGYAKELIKDFNVLKNKSIDKINCSMIKSYEYLQKAHIKDWNRLFERIEFELDDDEIQSISMDQRLKRLKKGFEDPGLCALYFQYGRYLMIASSRKGSEPANLQGIWNESPRADFSCNYTININLEMNYWMTGIGNLLECNEPLFDLIRDLSISGKSTARDSYCCDGWAASHNTDLWRLSTPVAVHPKHSYWPMGGVWLTSHMYMHYKYTMDNDFLLTEAYPIMKGAAEFLLAWMMEGKDGYLHSCPSTSPENSFYTKDKEECAVSYSSTMDLGLIKELFLNIIKINKDFNNDPDFADTIRDAYDKLPDFQIGKYGHLKEWIEDFEEAEPGHRHFSGLYAFFPSDLINEYDTPQLVDACKNLLERRTKYGSGHTGWSCAWLINFYARLHDGEKALYYLKYLFTNLSASNLFDLHPPLGLNVNETNVFQIDGNFGAVSGIGMMLLQSHLNEIHLLPALPKAWKNGRVKGLRAHNGFVVDMEWKDGILVSGIIHSEAGKLAKIKYNEKEIAIICDNLPVSTLLNNRRILEFNTKSGCSYTIITIW